MSLEVVIKTDLNQIKVQYLKGVGPKRAEYLSKLMIYSVEDMLYYLPKRYEDRCEFASIRSCRFGEFYTVMGTITNISERKVKNLQMLQVEICDMTDYLIATWFNQSYLKKQFPLGAKVVLSGRVNWRKKKVMNAPEYEILSDDASDLLHTGRIVPIYSLTEGLNQRIFRQIMRQTLDTYIHQIQDVYPTSFSITKALDEIHFPSNFSNKKSAHEKLAFNEFLILQVGILRRKALMLQTEHKEPYDYQELIHGFNEFKSKLKFTLTKDQEKVMHEIMNDLSQDKCMNRLLQGDVGSGKTVVAAFALLSAFKKGLQAALLAPTEILAEQHYRVIRDLLEDFHPRIALLIGEKSAKEKQHMYRLLARGEIHIVIGTHAIIQEDVQFQNLGLVVIDEQHRFGVEQRAKLKEKAKFPDILLMSATPIPRSLGLTLYGDLEKSVMLEKPPGRGKVTTHWIHSNRLPKVYNFIREQAQKGFQSFVICPLVEESEKLIVQAATQKYEELKANVFPDLRLGLIHGKMKAKDKDHITHLFSNGELDVLISTTVIEVGIDIPKATVMLIENAERFGLAQLHQLRGRIGRNVFRSYCILHGDPKSEDGIRRLKIMEETHDGFKIAEADLEIRGPGEILGTRQHGIPQLRVGNLITDFHILENARRVAEKIIDRDPHLNQPEHQLLKNELKYKFDQDFSLYEVG